MQWAISLKKIVQLVAKEFNMSKMIIQDESGEIKTDA